MVMSMDFNQQTPIYLQIADALCERILSGEWKPEDRIPSAREYGATLGVNPNTIIRSFDFLQNQQIIYNRRGIGYFVSPDAAELIRKNQKEQFISVDLPAVIKRMKLLGLSSDDFIAIWNKE